MDNEIAKTEEKEKSLIEEMAGRYNIDPATFLATMKSTIMAPAKVGIDREATNAELAMFLMVAKKYNLNPFIKEIYAFNAKKGGIVPIVGVDGWITIVERNPHYDGFTLTYSDKSTKDLSSQKVPCPEWCEITVYRKDRKHPVIIREYLDEVYVPPRGGYPGPWQSHTKRMLRHKTIMQGMRVAFGISGIYDEDEGHRIVAAMDMELLSDKPPVDLKSLQSKTDEKKADGKKGGSSPESKNPPVYDKAEGDAPPPTKTDVDILNSTDLPMKIADILKSFEYQKNRVGKDAYYGVLNSAGFKHANDIKERKPKVYVYEELKVLPDLDLTIAAADAMIPIPIVGE